MLGTVLNIIIEIIYVWTNLNKAELMVESMLLIPKKWFSFLFPQSASSHHELSSRKLKSTAMQILPIVPLFNY